MKFRCEHRIAQSAENLWQVLHTPEFEDHVSRAIGVSEYRELERRTESEAVYRRIRVVPSLPAALAGLLRRLGAGESVSAIEEQWRNQHEMEVRWRATPSVLADRIQIGGTVRIEPIDEHECLRILEGEVKVRLPGFGRALEQAVVNNTVETYGKSAAAASGFRETASS